MKEAAMLDRAFWSSYLPRPFVAVCLFSVGVAIEAAGFKKRL